MNYSIINGATLQSDGYLQRITGILVTDEKISVPTNLDALNVEMRSGNIIPIKVENTAGANIEPVRLDDIDGTKVTVKAGILGIQLINKGFIGKILQAMRIPENFKGYLCTEQNGQITIIGFRQSIETMKPMEFRIDTPDLPNGIFLNNEALPVLNITAYLGDINGFFKNFTKTTIDAVFTDFEGLLAATLVLEQSDENQILLHLEDDLQDIIFADEPITFEGDTTLIVSSIEKVQDTEFIRITKSGTGILTLPPNGVEGYVGVNKLVILV